MTPYYDEDGVTIYHGDYREALAAGVRATHVITDPPYDQRTHDGARNGLCDRPCIDFAPLGDVTAAARRLLDACDQWCVAFCSLEMLGDYARATGDRWVRSGFWLKPNGMPQFSGDRPGQPGEGIAIMHANKASGMRWNGRGRLALWTCNVEHGGRHHPTQKPIALMSSIVGDFANCGESILDPFCGAGTTLIAARDRGLRAVGIEIEERYCEVAAKRLSQMVLGLPEVST